jgi:Mannosyltransferase (PIG-V)
MTVRKGRDIRIIAIWAFWSLVVLSLAGVIAAFPVESKKLWETAWATAVHAPPTARWDSRWYWSVAQEGYRYQPDQPENNVGFYPGYPWLVGEVSTVLGLPLFGVGIGISLLALLGALLLLDRLAPERIGEEGRWETLLALLAFPTAFYFAAFYTEALFLLLTVVAFRGASKGRFWLAGAAGFLSSVTRPNGLLVALPILCFAFLQRGVSGTRKTAVAAGVAGPMLGAAVFPVFLWLRFGHPLLYVHSKAAGWGQRFEPVWAPLSRVVSDLWQQLRTPGLGREIVDLLQLGSVALFVILAVVLFRRRLWPEAVYLSATLLMVLFGGTLDGVSRYVLILFPGFFILGRALARSPTLKFCYLFGGAALNALLLYCFVQWIYSA